MSHRIRCVPQIAAAAALSVIAGCGVMSTADPVDNKEIVVGTTSAPSTLDPAAAWDSSWELFRNVYQTLLAYPLGATQPEPDAAQGCHFAGPGKRIYRCTLRSDLTFSNGDPLNAKAVKYSVDRIRKINVSGGPAGLLGSLDTVTTTGDDIVDFHLAKTDATFPFVLATPAMSIVDPADYPADSLRKDSEITGSGPYDLKKYLDGERAELTKNARYKGYAKMRNDAVTIEYFHSSGTMVSALKKKEIDATVRGLGAEDIAALQGGDANHRIDLADEAGTETSYLVFNPKDPQAGKLPVRRAVAQLIDRDAIAHKVYKDTVDPLYSMIPQGLVGHTAAFFDEYSSPDAGKARKILTAAGITEPVPLQLWYTSDRYGSATKTMFEEIKRQLEAAGLFKVVLNSRPWNQYEAGYLHGKYPVFGRGWAADFPDPDDFVTPFVGAHNALGTPYENTEITQQLLPSSRAQGDRSEVLEPFQRIQRILADDARLLPLWQGRQYVAANDGISGYESAFDASSIMMLWQLSRKTSW